jgi:hypothetical protein
MVTGNGAICYFENGMIRNPSRVEVKIKKEK